MFENVFTYLGNRISAIIGYNITCMNDEEVRKKTEV